MNEELKAIITIAQAMISLKPEVTMKLIRSKVSVAIDVLELTDVVEDYWVEAVSELFRRYNGRIVLEV